MVQFSRDPDFFLVQAPNKRDFKEIELLLLSRSIPFTVRNDFWQKAFFIPLEYESFAKNEIRSYYQENQNWPPLPPKEEPHRFHFSLINLWMVIALAAFHQLVSSSPIINSWFDTGKFSADNILKGEWWRLFTSLTLHLDDAHLLSNFFGLLLFASMVNSFLGPGVSWFVILLSGVLGNYFNALFYQTNHHAVGASTAVFGAIGLIAILGIKNYYHQRQFKGRYLIPFMAGFGLFAILGTNPQTDVTAHLFGFFAGNCLGITMLPLSSASWLRQKTLQYLMVCLTALLLHTAWGKALTTF